MRSFGGSRCSAFKISRALSFSSNSASAASVASALEPDRLDQLRYDLADGRPKASLQAVVEDAAWVSEQSPTTEQLAAVDCPVTLVRASDGFVDGTPPLISDEAHEVMANALDLVVDVDLAGANHYSMLWGAHAPVVAYAIDRLCASVRA